VIHIVVINPSPDSSRIAAVRGPGAARRAVYTPLRAPGPRAKSGVTLGGVSLGTFTETGVLPPERRLVLRARNGAFVFRVPAASAVMLTLPAR
jgi:hypothetical protein